MGNREFDRRTGTTSTGRSGESYTPGRSTLTELLPPVSGDEPRASGTLFRTPLAQFAERFNVEFRAQLHIFEEVDPAIMPAAERGPREERPSADTARAASSEHGVSATRLAQLFTPTQISLLDQFMSNHVIPDHLFNGDDVGTTTAQQRILLSGHILSTGTYAPGSFSQRVHARMCGHWVNLVYSYAGCATSMGAGAREEFDHTGALVLGVEEGATGAVEDMSRPGLDRGLGLGDHFSRTLARPDFEQIQAGDWLYVMNGNSSASGNHSVIFSRWVTDWIEEPVPHRRAVTMSQGSPDGGGHEEMRRIGTAYHAGDPPIAPITHVSRVASTSRPMTSVADLVAILGHGPEATDNARFIERLERDGRHFDAEIFKTYLREHNDALITELASHHTTTGTSIMTEQQQQIFRDTNTQATEIPVLVRLYQRLRVLCDNAAAVETERDERGAAIDTAHDAAVAEVEPRRAALEDQIHAIDEEIRALEAEDELVAPTLEMYAAHAAELHAATTERARLRRERQTYRDERHGLPRADRASFDTYYGPRLREIEARLDELQDTINRLSDEADATTADRAAARSESRRIAGLLRRAHNRRAPLQRQLDGLEGASGYHTAHGGVGRADFNGTDERRSVTGRLRDLEPQPDWQQFLTAAGGGSAAIVVTAD